VTDINFKLDASLLGFGFCRRSKGYTVCSHSGVIFKVPLRSGLFSHISSQTKENTGGNCILSVRNRKKKHKLYRNFSIATLLLFCFNSTQPSRLCYISAALATGD